MKLNDLLAGEPTLLYMERYVDEGTRTYSPFAAKTEVAPEFRPRNEQPSFDLISVRVPREQITVVEASPLARLRDRYIQSGEVLFLVHPETWKSPPVHRLDQLRALPRGPTIKVAPTASTRTVLTLEPGENVPHHFVKLHYPRRISRFNRRLRRKNIHNSVAAARDVAQVHFPKFAYLPDAIGFLLGNDEASWGFLIREATPHPEVERPRFLVPYFSLYGGDLQRPDDPPLLVQLIKQLGAEPTAFVVDEIMIPVIECWTKVVRERGLLLESHAQNLLLELDESLRPQRVVHRDFDVWIDFGARRRMGLDMPFLDSEVGHDSEYPIEQHYSLIYDRFIGHELLDYLLAVLKRFFGANESAVKAQVAETFHRNFPDAENFFPARTTYYFSNEVLAGNDFHLVDTHEPPQWR